MKRKIKFMATAFFSIMLAMCMVISPMAMSSIEPRWSNIQSTDLSIIFDDDEAEILAIAERQSTATSIDATLTLYKQVNGRFVYITEWHKSTTRASVTFAELVDVVSGTTYKAVFEVTVYDGNVPETDITEIIRVCP